MAADTTADAFELEDDFSWLHIQAVMNGVSVTISNKQTGNGLGVVLEGLEPGQVADAIRLAARKVAH